MRKLHLLIILMALILISCSRNKDIIIVVSKVDDSESYKQYKVWLTELCPEAKIVNLYKMNLEEAKDAMKEADALVLSGGPDVHPGRYGRIMDAARCSIDARRDTLEFMAAKYALDKKMPIMAICRGEQLLNVMLGGKLIVDLPEDMHTDIHQIENSPNAKHEIGIVSGSMLHGLVKISKGIVNTNHHQAVTYLPNEFTPVAFALEDQIIEAYEWRDPENKSFLIAVQWHPERLGLDNPLSKNIGEKFIEEVKKYNFK